MVYAFFNEIKNWSLHPDKILVTLEIGKVSILLLQLPFFSLKDLWHDVEVWWLSSSLVCDGGAMMKVLVLGSDGSFFVCNLE